MNLAELMATDVLSVSPGSNVADTARRMVERDAGVAVVLDDGDLVGIISERDMLRLVGERGDLETTVGDRMTQHVMVGSPSMTLPEALAIMIQGKFRHLPVVESGRVVGIVSMRDLMAWTSMQLRGGGRIEHDGDYDPSDLVATIHQMRTGAN
jgi:CBS domain-containing protein